MSRKTPQTKQFEHIFQVRARSINPRAWTRYGFPPTAFCCPGQSQSQLIGGGCCYAFFSLLDNCASTCTTGSSLRWPLETTELYANRPLLRAFSMNKLPLHRLFRFPKLIYFRCGCRIRRSRKCAMRRSLASRKVRNTLGACVGGKVPMSLWDDVG